MERLSQEMRSLVQACLSALGKAALWSRPRYVAGAPIVLCASFLCLATAKSDEAPGGGRDIANLADKIAQLSRSHRYIVLADSDHSSVGIMELLANPKLTEALSRSGFEVIFLEGPVDQNKGYDQPILESSPDEVARQVRLLQGVLQEEGYDVETSGVFDQRTIDAQFAFLTVLKADDYWGWDEDETGEYSHDFGDHIGRKLGRAADSREALRYRTVVDVLKFLKDTGNGAVTPTLATELQDIRNGYVTREDLYARYPPLFHVDRPELSRRYVRASVDLLFNAVEWELAVLYADERYHVLEEDPELNAYFSFVSERWSDDAMFDDVWIGALLNCRPELRPADKKLYDFLRYSLSPDAHAAIARNIRDLSRGRKSLVVYGAGHMTGVRDLDEMLEGRAATVYLFPEPDKVSLVDDPSDPTALAPILDLPEYFYDIPADRIVEITASGESESEFRSRFRSYLTPAEYEKAVSRLPQDLSGCALPYSEHDESRDNDQVEWLKHHYDDD